MKTFKTYQKVNTSNSDSFSISRMEDIYNKRDGAIDEPHRHDYFTVLIVQSSKGEHIIDFKSYTLLEHQIFFIQPGTVHQVIEEAQSFGYAITFSNDFLGHNNIPIDFIDNLNLFDSFGENPPLEINLTVFEKIKGLAEQMITYHGSQMNFKYDAIGSLLKLLLIESNNACEKPKAATGTDKKHQILIDYKQLLNQHFKDWHTVNEYAEALHISPDYFNRVIKNATGKTAKEHIQNRIILAAKRMIYFSDLSTKELAFELGFSEATNFSTFFKKCTGLSPSDFKKSAQVGKS